MTDMLRTQLDAVRTQLYAIEAESCETNDLNVPRLPTSRKSWNILGRKACPLLSRLVNFCRPSKLVKERPGRQRPTRPAGYSRHSCSSRSCVEVAVCVTNQGAGIGESAILGATRAAGRRATERARATARAGERKGSERGVVGMSHTSQGDSLQTREHSRAGDSAGGHQGD